MKFIFECWKICYIIDHNYQTDSKFVILSLLLVSLDGICYNISSHADFIFKCSLITKENLCFYKLVTNFQIQKKKTYLLFLFTS